MLLLRVITLLLSVVNLFTLLDTMDVSKLKIEELPSPLSQLGEGPTWDMGTMSLYYVDILGAAVLRYDYIENKTYRATIDGISPISIIILIKEKPGYYLLGVGHKLELIRWDGRSENAFHVKTIGDLGDSVQRERFNDGKVDPQGRLYAGTMLREELGDILNHTEGKLYRFEGKIGGKFYEQKCNITISNGLTWDERIGKFYYIDSGALDVKEFDVLENGDICNEKVLFDLRKDGKEPGYFADGMTSDADGNLYVAIWGGSKVLIINPCTKQIDSIPIPAEKVTSVAFGGPQLDELFVTTAHTKDQDPPAGALFKVTGLGVKGKEMYKMVLQE